MEECIMRRMLLINSEDIDWKCVYGIVIALNPKLQINDWSWGKNVNSTIEVENPSEECEYERLIRWW